MARLQILELPEGSGDERPPFILVIDQMPTSEPEFDTLRRDLADNDIAARTGARAVLAFEGTIDIPANEFPVDPDGYPVKVRIEGDFEQFREQVEDEIRKAQADLVKALNSDTERSPEE